MPFQYIGTWIEDRECKSRHMSSYVIDTPRSQDTLHIGHVHSYTQQLNLVGPPRDRDLLGGVLGGPNVRGRAQVNFLLTFAH